MMSPSDLPPSSGDSTHGHGSYTRHQSMTSGVRVLRPTAVTEKSLMESVAGFINEVQAINLHGSSGSSRDPKVNVTWARFEVADINDIRLFPQGGDVNGNVPPLLLILGYTQGVQIWLIPQSGEAQEILSWKQGVVKTLRLLPTPEARHGMPDNYAHCRPLIGLADSTGPSTPFSTANFISLKSGELAHCIKFNNEIVDLAVNRHVVVVTLREKLAVFDACNFTAKFHISCCYPSPGVDPNPITLGDRWMAYADRRLLHVHKSCGGMETDSSQSMTAWGINVGSKLAQGVSRIYSNFFSTGMPPSSSSPSSRGVPASPTSGASSGVAGGSLSGPQKGIVTVLDLLEVPNAKGEELPLVDKIPGIVAHFIAHNKAISALKFDSTGNLLLTCDSAGHYFHLFRILPFPAGSSYSAVHHLYTLYRGDTPGTVQDVAFSSDNRLVAVSTLRGTTHVFPITPYGGQVGVRTHTAPRVVNRLSRFHRSAGIDEHRSSTTATSSGRNSPNPNSMGTSPVVSSSLSKLSLGGIDHIGNCPPMVIPYPNPYIPPFPTPTLVQPIAQLRQPYIVTLTNQTIGTASSAARKKSITSAGEDVVSVRLAVNFAPPRAWLLGTQHHMFGRQQQKRAHDSLFVMANHGVLLEYTLDVTPESTLPKEKICESSPIELHVTAHGQWALTQPRDLAQLQPPLPIDNPVMLPIKAMHGYSYGAGGARDAANVDDSDDEDRWLSQVEITTHVGPHRRLWMGPQFSFKTLVPNEDGKGEQQIVDLDVTLPNRPDQSTPVNITSHSSVQHRPSGGQTGAGRVPVLIEASSASSFELSPRFSSHPFGSSSRHPSSSSAKDHPMAAGQMDLEHELQEAMTETVVGEESLDGTSKRKSSKQQQRRQNEDDEFFCLTPDESRRSRNASATSQPSLPVHMEMPDAKILSVAVEEAGRKAAGKSSSDSMKVRNVDTSGMSGKEVAVLTNKMSPTDDGKVAQKLPAEARREEEHPKLTAVTPSSSSSSSSKKGKKKNKKKQNSASNKSCSSSDEIQMQLEDASSSNLLDFESATKTMEVAPQKEEEITPMPKPLNLKAKTAKETKEEDNSKLLAEVAEAMVEVDTSTDEFLPVRRGRLTSTEEEEKDEEESPSFVVKEPLDEDDEDEDSAARAKPPPLSSGWLSAVLTKPDAIIQSIQSSETRWETKTSDDNSSSCKEESGGNSNMATSTGFNYRKSATSSQDDSSEDDFDFRPPFSKKKNKKQSASSGQKEPIRSRTGSFADSESSLPACSSENTSKEDQENSNKNTNLLNFDTKDDGKEGWSFEADDLDVDKLIDEVVGKGIPEEDEKEEEEKTPLEDVFKFDSEMAINRKGSNSNNEDSDEEEYNDNGKNKKKFHSMEDLKKECESASGNSDEASNNASSKGASGKAMSTSLNVTFDENNLISSSGGGGGCGGTSESSVGSSPNPKKSGKGKKKKKKRAF